MIDHPNCCSFTQFFMPLHDPAWFPIFSAVLRLILDYLEKPGNDGGGEGLVIP